MPDLPACLAPGQPASDTHCSRHEGTCLGGDTHLSWLYSSGCWTEDPEVRTRLRAGTSGEAEGGACMTRTDLGGHQAVRV